MAALIYGNEAVPTTRSPSFVSMVVSSVGVIYALMLQISALSLSMWRPRRGEWRNYGTLPLFGHDYGYVPTFLKAVRTLEMLGVLLGFVGFILFIVIMVRRQYIWAKNLPILGKDSFLLIGYVASLFLAAMSIMIGSTLILIFIEERDIMYSPCMALISSIFFLIVTTISGKAAGDIIFFRK